MEWVNFGKVKQTCAARVLSGGARMREVAAGHGLEVLVIKLPFPAPHFRSTVSVARALNLADVRRQSTLRWSGDAGN